MYDWFTIVIYIILKVISEYIVKPNIFIILFNTFQLFKPHIYIFEISIPLIKNSNIGPTKFQNIYYKRLDITLFLLF
jgi:hypothetical protein